MPIIVSRVAENSIIVHFGNSIDSALIAVIANFTEALQQKFQDVIYDITPSYTSVFVEYNPLQISAYQLVDWCKSNAEMYHHNIQPNSAKLVTLPVYYHPEVAPDLESVANINQLSIQQVIDIHSQKDYTVCAIGFAPGFGFLGTVDDRIATPRHAMPRLKVAKGSVGIADQQTAVYPQDTPGGWQIIGNCPVNLFDVSNSPMMPFDVGDTIRFCPISREEFIQQGGVL